MNGENFMNNDEQKLVDRKKIDQVVADEMDQIDYLFYRVIDEYQNRGFDMDDVIKDYEDGHLSISDIRMYAQGTLNLRDF